VDEVNDIAVSVGEENQPVPLSGERLTQKSSTMIAK